MDAILLMNGSQVYDKIFNPCFIEAENAWYGKTADGDYYYAWDLVHEDQATSFRRAS